MAKASRKAPEDWPSPKAGATSYGTDGREASWTAPVLWRFLTSAAALTRLINAQAEKILVRSGRDRNLQSYIAANDARVCDQVSPINKVWRASNDIRHIL